MLTSAGNYYGPDVTQAEAEEFYAQRKPTGDPRPVMMGMNSRLVRGQYGFLEENVWREGGLYGAAITQIIKHLEAAVPFAENDDQGLRHSSPHRVLSHRRPPHLRPLFHPVAQRRGRATSDFVNGFIESYGDPLGMKASWESIVNFKDVAATERAHTLALNAQWFEDHSPVDARSRKRK